MPQPLPPKRNRTPAIVVSVVVAFAAVAGVLAVVFLKDSSELPAGGDYADVGQCVAFTGQEDMAVTKVLDCSDPDAVSKVVVTHDSTATPCPDGDYDEFHYADGSKLCLVLNVDEGDCLANTTSGRLTELAKVSCTDSGAEVSVLKTVTGTADTGAACAPADGTVVALRYSEPPTVVCLGRPQYA